MAQQRQGIPEDVAGFWEQITGGAIKDPMSVEDTRGKVLDPATDRRLTPHDRVLAVMDQNEGMSYEDAAKRVVKAMVAQGEIDREMVEQMQGQEEEGGEHGRKGGGSSSSQK